MDHRTFLLAALIVCLAACRAPADPEKLPGPDQLPEVKQLPDPFVFQDGSRVRTLENWRRRREELIRLIQGYEFGHSAPPASVHGDRVGSTPAASGATEERVHLRIGDDDKISSTVILTLPAGKGPWPVIVKGDLCWGRVKPEIVSEVLRHGYAFAEFDRTDFAPDSKDRSKGVFAVYAELDWGDLAAWAWGFQRVVDYLCSRPDVAGNKIVVTGHSRGGKAALLSGALDERIALTVPNGSGCGGAGCLRIAPPKTENIAIITDHFPNWFTPRFREFAAKAERLPFDHHELKALVAPRALLSTDALGDVWANPIGTEQTYLGAKVVFEFLNAGDKIGLHFRQGGHDQTLEDFSALLDFADHLFFGKPTRERFDALPLPIEEKGFDWRAPAPTRQ